MSTVEIPLNHGKFALVEESDLSVIADYRWRLMVDKKKSDRKQNYAVTTTPDNEIIFMHRLIMGASPDVVIDHRDNDGLNNVRDNLRICTRRQNQMNRRKVSHPTTSKYKGVHKKRRAKKKPWYAAIRISGRKTYLGLFATEIEAAQAYDVASRQHFGEFALTNFQDALRSGGAA